MQIDFHHGTTYVAARLAGFDRKEAGIVAHAAQYVDDATSSGVVHFNNKSIYHRLCTAHKTLDPRNSIELNNHLVWIPFHFLPGNGGKNADENGDLSFVEKIVCRPGNDNPIARQLLREVISEKGHLCSLHRLGLTMHVYADTWAHQNFAGVEDKINEVDHAVDKGKSGVFSEFGKVFHDWLDDTLPALGHARANVFPDMPFLDWEYTNAAKEKVRRNNTDLFCTAADEMCKAMQRYRVSDPDADVPGIPARDMNKIQDLFSTLKEVDGGKRHYRWLMEIRDGAFSFGKDPDVDYVDKGADSWKEKALGTSNIIPRYPYRKSFLKSDWKLFHDAAKVHAVYLINELLPEYGVCAG
ncbi:MAG: hypothetical protein BM485_12680 [Desulfobulbaceae bacterium DB1]|nr:MAG: hypothetical protein BM485_12680 [Desulfobulbaceae bacterium DB1]